MTDADKLTQAMGSDRSGCVCVMVFWLIVVLLGTVGMVGSNEDHPQGTAKDKQVDTALGLPPSLKTTNTAPPPTLAPTTLPPVPETQPPVVVVPQQQGGSSGGTGSSGGGGQTPQQPQIPSEVCETTGSISVSNGDRGSLGGGGGTYKANGGSSVNFSGYPFCHSYQFTVSGSNGTSGKGCFQTGTGLSLGSLAGETITVSVVASPGSPCG